MTVLSFLNSFFKTRGTSSKNPKSTLVTKLKSLTSQSNIFVFENIEIYHHAQNIIVPLIAFDPLRGLYIFESKLWDFDDLNNAQITKARHQVSSEKTLAFDNIQTLINKKFNELIHRGSLPIYNFVLLERLESQEYDQLNESVKKYLPFERLIFCDYENSDIFHALQKIQKFDNTDYSQELVLSTLFTQYAFLDSDQRACFSNSEQKAFLDADLSKLSSLDGVASSGKSTLLLLKSIIMLMRDPSLKVLILKPTLLASDILKKKLLEIVEYSIFDINLDAIEIITPLELLNKHLKKLKKSPLKSISQLDTTKPYKNFFISDIVMCDDTHLLAQPFVEYLQQSQKKSKLLLVNAHLQNSSEVTQQYKGDAHQYIFLKTNPYAKAIQLSQKLLKDAQTGDIIIVSKGDTREKLIEDLKDFLPQAPALIDATFGLLAQSLTALSLATYSDINALSAKHIIILDISSSNIDEVEYACNIASHSTHLLYAEECEEISKLKDRYASNQER